MDLVSDLSMGAIVIQKNHSGRGKIDSVGILRETSKDSR